MLKRPHWWRKRGKAKWGYSRTLMRWSLPSFPINLGVSICDKPRKDVVSDLTDCMPNHRHPGSDRLTNLAKNASWSFRDTRICVWTSAVGGNSIDQMREINLTHNLNFSRYSKRFFLLLLHVPRRNWRRQAFTRGIMYHLNEACTLQSRVVETRILDYPCLNTRKALDSRNLKSHEFKTHGIN